MATLKTAQDKALETMSAEIAAQVEKDNVPAKAGKTTVSTKGIDQEILKGKYNIRAMTEKTALTEILLIAAMGKDIRKKLHEVACGIMLHYETHGDYTALQRDNDEQPVRLFEVIKDVLSRSMQQAFIDWCALNTSIRFNENTGRFYHNKRDKRIPEGRKGYFNYDATNAGNEFFKFERPQGRPVALSAEAVLAILKTTVQRLERLQKEATEGKEVNGKTVKVRHEIPAGLVEDFEKFAIEHGVKLTDEAEAA